MGTLRKIGGREGLNMTKAKHNAIKAYWGPGGIAPRIRRMWMVNLMMRSPSGDAVAHL
jgi:hypothetical protein